MFIFSSLDDSWERGHLSSLLVCPQHQCKPWWLPSSADITTDLKPRAFGGQHHLSRTFFFSLEILFYRYLVIITSCMFFLNVWLWYEDFSSLKLIFRMMIIAQHSVYTKNHWCGVKKGKGKNLGGVLMVAGAGWVWKRWRWSLLAPVHGDLQQPRAETVNSERTLAELGLENGESRMYPRVDHEPQIHPWANKVKGNWKELRSQHCPPFLKSLKPLTWAAVDKLLCFHGREKYILSWIITNRWE